MRGCGQLLAAGRNVRLAGSIQVGAVQGFCPGSPLASLPNPGCDDYEGSAVSPTKERNGMARRIRDSTLICIAVLILLCVCTGAHNASAAEPSHLYNFSRTAGYATILGNDDPVPAAEDAAFAAVAALITVVGGLFALDRKQRASDRRNEQSKRMGELRDALQEFYDVSSRLRLEMAQEEKDSYTITYLKGRTVRCKARVDSLAPAASDYAADIRSATSNVLEALGLDEPPSGKRRPSDSESAARGASDAHWANLSEVMHRVPR